MNLTNCQVHNKHPVDKNNLVLKKLLNFFFEIDRKVETQKILIFLRTTIYIKLKKKINSKQKVPEGPI